MPAEPHIHLQLQLLPVPNQRNTGNGSVCEEAWASRGNGPRASEGQDQDQLLWERQDQVRPLNTWITGKKTKSKAKQTCDKFGWHVLLRFKHATIRSFIILLIFGKNAHFNSMFSSTVTEGLRLKASCG